MQIQNYMPMWLNLRARFVIEGGRLRMDHIEIDSDGAKTVASGDLDLSSWPEQSYGVGSRVQFARMSDIFFSEQNWDLTGDGDVTGTFHLFKGGHDLAARSGVRWPPSTNTGSRAFRALSSGAATASTSGMRGPNSSGGTPSSPSRLSRSARKSGRRRASTPATRTWTSRSCQTSSSFPGFAFAGSATGRNLLEWPIGRFRESRGDGEFAIDPPAGTTTMRASLASARAADPDHSGHEWGPFAPHVLPAHLPIGASGSYRFDADQLQVNSSRFATEKTHVAFEGETAWGDPASFAFRVTSSDWQESDQVLAGILTDFGARTGPVAFGGRGEFDGVMTGSLPQAPRRRGLQRRRHAGLGHAVGRRQRTDCGRKQLCHGHRRDRAARRLGDSRRRPLLARLSPARRRRGARRTHPRLAARPRLVAARVRD